MAEVATAKDLIQEGQSLEETRMKKISMKRASRMGPITTKKTCHKKIACCCGNSTRSNLPYSKFRRKLSSPSSIRAQGASLLALRCSMEELQQLVVWEAVPSLERVALSSVEALSSRWVRWEAQVPLAQSAA
jgi:hypothetical protein